MRRGIVYPGDSLFGMDTCFGQHNYLQQNALIFLDSTKCVGGSNAAVKGLPLAVPKHGALEPSQKLPLHDPMAY